MKITDENELVQYIIVNKDLHMSAGKIASQVGHVCTICAVKSIDDNAFRRWYCHENQPKIVLHAHLKDIEKLIQKGFDMFIYDLGRTEIARNSLTALSLGVMTRKEAEPYIKKFQLLR